jgi:hypothetical protein
VQLAAIAAAQPISSAPEHSIKAAYLYNFAAYVQWPQAALAEPDASLVIGVFGDEFVADELEAMTRGRPVGGRRMEVKRVAAGSSLAGLHMLFIGGEPADMPRLISDARAHSVLVVTELRDALDSGSVINFRLIDDRVRFEISLDAADESGLIISSRLLAVAEDVRPRRGG